MPKEYILITGALGFIGHHLSFFLAKKKYKLILVDNFERTLKKKYLNKRIERLKSYKNVKIINLDIRNISNSKKINYKIKTIIHLAAINGTKNFYNNPDKVLDILLSGGYSILKFAHKKKIDNIFFFSSSEVYQKPKSIPTNEEIECVVPDIWNPRYSYGGGKIAQELMISNLYPKSFKKRIIIRPHNIYGQNMGHDHVIPEVIKKIKTANRKKKNSIEIIGPAKNTRSFMHIDDFLNAFYLIFKSKKNREIFNIGNNDEIDIKSLIKKILNKMNCKLKIKEKIFKNFGQTNRRCPDINKIEKLGYKQKITLDKGIDDIINNFK
jgi:nucleoside-diphosphate-sugar epimerase